MRQREDLLRRYAAIASAAGLMLLLGAAVMLTPLVALAAWPEELGHAWAFVVPAAGLAALGLGLRRAFPHPPGVVLTVQEGGVLVVACWLVVILFSAWPFAAVAGLAPTRALFESVSGWTTTGLSVVDVAEAAHVVLLWRSITQFAGGAGLAILALSAIVGTTGVGISSAEGRSDQLVPQVRRSARLVLGIYAAYAGVGALAYLLVGLTPFDAVNHAFAAVSTGGFSTHAESIGYWDSRAVEAVTLPLMLLGSLSFLTAWPLFRGRLGAVARSSELRLVAVVLPVATAALFLLTTRWAYPRLGDAVRGAVFETVSALTTTGFTTVTYAGWNGFGLLLLIVLMTIGGGTGSTAGGMKQYRVFLVWKLVQWEVRRALMPRSAVLERPVWEANRRAFVDDAELQRVLAFVVVYLSAYVLGVMVLTASGVDLEAALFEFASALGTVGLSVGVTGAGMPDPALWAVMGAMFLGRLEFMVVLVSVAKLLADGRALLGRGGRRAARERG